MWLNSLFGSALLSVETCSKAILVLCRGHGKSPCFSEVAFLRLIGVDARLLKLVCLDGTKILKCAF